MSFRAALLLVVALVALMITLERVQGTTPTEALALRQAAVSRPVYTLPPEKLKPAQELFRARTALHFVGEGWGILQLVLLLTLGVPARMRNVAENLTKNRWGQGFVFAFLFLLAITLLNFPLRIYGHHVAMAYGLSVQGWGSWAWDLTKGFLLTWFVGALLAMVLFWVIRKSPKHWWFWFWIPTMAGVLFGVFVSPILVDPLFNKFEPLQKRNPALVQQLEKVVTRSGVSLPPDRMFFMQASQKVTSLNAYVTGFGPSKRLVLWDTTIASSTPDELSGVFGHELGHYALHHIVRGLLFTAALLLIAFFLGQKITQWLLRRYGGRWRIRSQNDWAFMAVLVLVLNALNFVSEPIDNAFSRSIEHAADVYGQEAIHGIVADPQTTTQQGFQRLGEASRRPCAASLCRLLDFKPPLNREPRGLCRGLQPMETRAASEVLSTIKMKITSSPTHPSSDCLFCMIVSGTIPANRVYEDECCIGFPDINPQAPTHLLIIPKQHIGSTAKALAEDTALMGHLMAASAEIARKEKLDKGYRIVVNTGDDGGQTVHHLHLHLLGGRHMNWPPG